MRAAVVPGFEEPLEEPLRVREVSKPGPVAGEPVVKTGTSRPWRTGVRASKGDRPVVLEPVGGVGEVCGRGSAPRTGGAARKETVD